MAAEELVERVLTGHVHREARIAASGPAPHLAQARHRAREGHAERRVQIPDVDAELERVGGHDRQQIALREALLDLAALRRRVAGAVGRDALRQIGPPRVLEPLAREALDQLHTSARLQEADRPDLALDQLGQQVRGLGQRGGPTPQALVHERRVPHRDLALRSRRAVAVHELHLHSREPLGKLGRVRDRGAREQETRVAAVGPRKPAQAAQHVRHVRAEHTAVHMRLVHDDPGEVREHISPRAVVRQNADVEHVRVREDQVRALPNRAPLLARRVAVVDGLAQVLAAGARRKAREAAGLVLRERLRRVEVEGARGHVARQGVEDRQVERERLAARGARGDDGVAAAGRLERVGLVCPQRLDPGRRQSIEHSRVEIVRDGL